MSLTSVGSHRVRRGAGLSTAGPGRRLDVARRPWEPRTAAAPASSRHAHEIPHAQLLARQRDRGAALAAFTGFGRVENSSADRTGLAVYLHQPGEVGRGRCPASSSKWKPRVWLGDEDKVPSAGWSRPCAALPGSSSTSATPRAARAGLAHAAGQPGCPRTRVPIWWSATANARESTVQVLHACLRYTCSKPPSAAPG